MSTFKSVSISDWFAIALAVLGLALYLFGTRGLETVGLVLFGFGLGRVRFGRAA